MSDQIIVMEAGELLKLARLRKFIVHQQRPMWQILLVK